MNACHDVTDGAQGSEVTLRAMREFSGLSLTVMVSLYSATRSLSRGLFTCTTPVWQIERGRGHDSFLTIVYGKAEVCPTPSPLSNRVIDVEGSVLVASSDVVGQQRVASAVCILPSYSGHRGVNGCALAHAGVVRQVQEDWVIVIDVSDIDPHHHLKHSHGYILIMVLMK